MSHTHLISVAELKALQTSGQPLLVFDCSFDLVDPGLADVLFEKERIAGAVQAHLDRHLSTHAASEAVNGGRHPLPGRESFAGTLRELGFDNAMQAVVYDRNGSGFCGRLWWMLKWAGHDAVAVLDGGLQAWLAAGGPVTRGEAAPRPQGNFQLKPELRHWVGTTQVAERLQQASQTIIDARAPERFRGEVEPLDPVAGHIPGALNRPFGDNLGPDGRFKTPAQLRQEFDALLAGRDPAGAVLHCGSGVSTMPNAIAMELAGYPPPAIYAGSWSEWCRTPGLPCATG